MANSAWNLPYLDMAYERLTETEKIHLYINDEMADKILLTLIYRLLSLLKFPMTQMK